MCQSDVREKAQKKALEISTFKRTSKEAQATASQIEGLSLP